MKPDIEQLRILYTEKDICLPLRHCGADDISVNWEIDSIVKNRGLFESLYAEYPLTGVYDKDTFWYYFLTEKISGMSGLCKFLDRNAAELLLTLSGQAGEALLKTTPAAVQYIKENAEEIFSDPEQDPELRYAAADFVIRNQTDFITRNEEGISAPVFEILCRLMPHLIVSRFGDLRQIFIRYQDKDLFSLLFRDGSLKDILDIGLGDVLDAWREEYSEADSPFRFEINRHADRLWCEAKSFYERSLSDRKILKAVNVLRAVSLFLRQIRPGRASRESARYARDAEQQLLQYLLAAGTSPEFLIPSDKASPPKWKPINPLTEPLYALTHQDRSADNPGPNPESYLDKSSQSYAAFKNLSREGFLSELEDVNAENFLIILDNKNIFKDYIKKVWRTARSISKQPDMSGFLLSDDVRMLISMIISVRRNLGASENIHKEALCYSASMFCCSLTEKLLRIFYLYCSQIRNIQPVTKHIRKQQYFTLGCLADKRIKMAGSFTMEHRKGLVYFLSRIRGMKECRSYRNRLAHWLSAMTPKSMTADLTSRLLWLFTDVLNSVYLYFVPGKSGAVIPLPSQHQSQSMTKQCLSGSVK